MAAIEEIGTASSNEQDISGSYAREIADEIMDYIQST